MAEVKGLSHEEEEHYARTVWGVASAKTGPAFEGVEIPEVPRHVWRAELGRRLHTLEGLNLEAWYHIVNRPYGESSGQCALFLETDLERIDAYRAERDERLEEIEAALDRFERTGAY